MGNRQIAGNNYKQESKDYRLLVPWHVMPLRSESVDTVDRLRPRLCCVNQITEVVRRGKWWRIDRNGSEWITIRFKRDLIAVKSFQREEWVATSSRILESAVLSIKYDALQSPQKSITPVGHTVTLSEAIGPMFSWSAVYNESNRISSVGCLKGIQISIH